jgi:hypothetical protein
MRFVLWVLIILVIAVSITGIYAKWHSPNEPVNDAFFRLIFGDPDLGRVDIRTMQRPASRSHALAAPAGFWQGGTPDIETKPLTMPAAAAFERIEQALRLHGQSIKQVESTMTPDGEMRRYVLRTRWLRFPDTLTVLITNTPNNPGIALYSQNQIGSYDWGVNRTRIDTVLGALQ